MQLWPVEYFWLTFFPADLEKKWAKSVQLFDFLQNPYFKQTLKDIIYCKIFRWSQINSWKFRKYYHSGN